VLKDMMRQMASGVPATVSRQHIEAAARAYLDSYVDGNVEARLPLFAEAAVGEDPVGAAPMVGKAALEAFWRGGVEAGWRVRHDFQRIIVCGNEALVLFSTHLEMPGSGTADVQVYENLVFDDAGKITRLRAFFDADCVS
jgi:steroid delta-isomerase